MPPKAKLKAEISNSEATWKSRFPVARIKKIMQADEDVGKVAQVVPVIISKALELFMASMISEASRHTVETGHKRVVPGHLKMAIKGNPMFDFLEGNIAAIADPVHVEARPVEDKKTRRPRMKKPNGAGRSGSDAVKEEVIDEDEDDDADEVQPTKRVRTEADHKNPSRSMSIANLVSPPSPTSRGLSQHS